MAFLAKGTRSRRLLLIAVALVASGCGRSPTQPTAALPSLPPPRAPRISRTIYLAFGDSLTVGTTSPVVLRLMSAGLPQSYPFKLQQLLAARYFDQSFVVENEGKPAEGAEGGVRLLKAVDNRGAQ